MYNCFYVYSLLRSGEEGYIYKLVILICYMLFVFINDVK